MSLGRVLSTFYRPHVRRCGQQCLHLGGVVPTVIPLSQRTSAAYSSNVKPAHGPRDDKGGQEVQGGESEHGASSSSSTSPPFSPHSSRPTTPSSTSSVSTHSTMSPLWEEKVSLKETQSYSDLPHENFGVNQHMVMEEDFKHALRGIMRQLPASLYCFGYGSGVFPQSGSGSATEEQIRAVHPYPCKAITAAQKGNPKMVDFILAVGESQHWHSVNMTKHPDHYSFLRWLPMGSSIAALVQDYMGAGVYFNTHVNINGTLVKYGVVNIKTLCRDLVKWDTLYLAGRLHKPVKILRDYPQVRLAQQINLLSAVRVALLLLPAKFTELHLYMAIASISYMGDPRMTLGAENPDKVADIVGHSIANFRNLYKSLLETMPSLAVTKGCLSADADVSSPVDIEQDMDPAKRGNMVRRLPAAFRHKLYEVYNLAWQGSHQQYLEMVENQDREDDVDMNSSLRDGGEFERRIASDDPEQLYLHVQFAVSQTVGRPSTRQSLKGILTAGPTKSFKYLAEKQAKYRKAKQKQTENAKTEQQEKH